MYFLSHPNGDRLNLYAVQAPNLQAAHIAALQHFGKGVTTRPCTEAEYKAFAK